MNRGWRSSKLHLSLICMALITGAFALSGFKETLFDAYCMALLGAAGIYSTAGTIEKFGKPKPE